MYTFGTYSDCQIDLEVLTCAAGAFSSAENMIWQSYASKYRDKMKFLRNTPGYTRKEKPPMEMRMFNDPQLGPGLVRIL